MVDDEPTVRMLIAEVLSESYYNIVEAGDGPSALKILETGRRIDLMITDVGLPGGMNGRQVADAARMLRKDLKVLFITGYAENAAVGNGQLDAGHGNPGQALRHVHLGEQGARDDRALISGASLAMRRRNRGALRNRPMVSAMPISTATTRSSLLVDPADHVAADHPAQGRADTGDAGLQPMHLRREDEDHHRAGIHHPRQHILGGGGVADGQARRGQRRQHQKADAAAEIAAIDRDAELRHAGAHRPSAGGRSALRGTKLP